MSYIQSIYHIVFRTYRSERTIDAKHERELYAIIMKQTENLKAKLIRIGGMPDHIHLLVSLPSDLSPAKYVQAIKTFQANGFVSVPFSLIGMGGVENTRLFHIMDEIRK